MYQDHIKVVKRKKEKVDLRKKLMRTSNWLKGGMRIIERMRMKMREGMKKKDGMKMMEGMKMREKMKMMEEMRMKKRMKKG